MVHFRVTAHGQATITSAEMRRKSEANSPVLAKLIAELEEYRRSQGLLVEDIQRLTTEMATWDRYIANIGVVSKSKPALRYRFYFSPFPPCTCCARGGSYF